MKKLLALLLLFSGVLNAVPLKNLVIFGDSLSDNGNLYHFLQEHYPKNKPLPESPPYYQGRFTNGPVWVERLAAALFPDKPEAHLRDYARGGASVINHRSSERIYLALQTEVSDYLFEHSDRASEDSLFIIWIGANNYLHFYGDPQKNLENVNKGIAYNLTRLVKAGAKHILVLNLPDLGKMPLAAVTESEKELSHFTALHNRALAETITKLNRTFPKVQWISYDVNQLVNEILSSPAEYGFDNIKDTCNLSEVDKFSKKSVLQVTARTVSSGTVDACQGYLFFDPVHPTAAMHQLMADRVRNMLKEAGIF